MRIPKSGLFVFPVTTFRKEESYDDQKSSEEDGGNLQVQKLLLNSIRLKIRLGRGICRALQ